MVDASDPARVLRPLDARRRAAIRHWVPRLVAVFLLAVLPLAAPSAGPGGWSPGIIVLALVPAAPFVIAYLYVRNSSIALEAGRLKWTDLLGRPHSLPTTAVTEMIGRRLWVGPFAVDVVALRAGPRDAIRLPRVAWNLDAVERLAERLGVPTRNAEGAVGHTPSAGRSRLAG